MIHRRRAVLAMGCALAGLEWRRGPPLNSFVNSPMKRNSAVIAYAIAAVPVLVLGQCMYKEIAQPRELAALCAATTRGTTTQQVLEKAAANESLKARTGGPAGKDDRDWFDREYLRLGEYLRKTKSLSDDYTVVFAKPGMGYHACIIVHKGNVVKEAWFEDRSS